MFNYLGIVFKLYFVCATQQARYFNYLASAYTIANLHLACWVAFRVGIFYFRMSVLKKSELVFAPHPNNKRFRNLKGRRINKFYVVGYAGGITQGFRASTWFVECDCGTIKTITTTDILNPEVKSCGCHKRKATGDRGRTHGMSKTPTYMSYRAAKGRCENPKDSKYKYYGGRGIKFLYKSFEQFFADLGERTSRKLTLDRIDTNGHYVPGNCKWVTRREQAHNFRKCVVVNIEGVDIILAALFKPEHPTSWKHKSARRIKKFNWPVMAALFAPAGMRKKEAVAFVKGKSFEQLATAAGLNIPPAINAASQPRKIERKKDAA